jgi:aromatic ring-opening dioxygenase catalytic subunit (LigB family)
LSPPRTDPALLWPKNLDNPRGDLMGDISGPDGLLPQFLRDFGKTLIEKYAFFPFFQLARLTFTLARYNPKGIIVFSAHWDDAELLVTDYKPENPLLYDYYGFPEQLYDITYRSRGDSALSKHITETFESHGLTARTTPDTEPRGRDGRRRNRPLVESGLDHGVFLPFKLMFPDTASPDGVFPIPIVEVSMSSTFEPEPQWEIGAAIKELREQGYLILAGGLTVHDFGDFSSFNSDRAKPVSNGRAAR